MTDAAASTVRTRMGYRTGETGGLSAFIEFEDVSEVGEKKYGGNYSVVADPEITELNQAYVSYQAPGKSNVLLGRQRLILDNARFVGNVGWRQNEQ
ncbi:MAG: hypothetical protein GWN14_06840, partial [candidate division Zixibacteria bacterium]|nr:hypothetical protein [candidate division Zixibacteria bacterium]